MTRVLLLVVCATIPAVALQPSAAELVSKASAYLAKYEREVTAIVSEEDYEQVTGDLRVVRRQLRSDVLVISHDATGWVVFRDVFEMDGRPVRDRDDRLARLFLKPDADTIRQALRIASEGARFNLEFRGSDRARTVNNPMTALRFLRPVNISRSVFRTVGQESVGGVQTNIVRFTETAKPRLVITGDDAASRGRFWIEPQSGRVMQTELAIDTRLAGKVASIRLRVTFGHDANLGILVPSSMTEDYGLGPTEAIRGNAKYRNFRRFSVDTTTLFKPPSDD
jgi:hypothetical protein